ncbi:hypothetical protein [Sphingomonas aerophila]|uniref:Ca2+-binding RTX toxin-like protein n=1 Tax=Sphingomonas aerophila TaxID=1344948 RepID=A0A7W9BCM2_9SPHN|nr:hypothetical protein [Sphingomonas aerophila]MBB5714774.1 Ca2+-binding RTX toxin-like protein [Sphingomonas aerophila]
MKILIFAAMALGLATPALAETYRIPATAGTNKAACPKAPVVATEPGSTITGDDLPRTLSGYVTIDLKAGKVKVGNCSFRISGFANATGSPFGATLVGDDNANVLTGIAADKGGASDGIRGNGGDDTISTKAATALVWGGAGRDRFAVPADRKIKIGGKTYAQPVVQD